MRTIRAEGHDPDVLETLGPVTAGIGAAWPSGLVATGQLYRDEEHRGQLLELILR